MGHPSERSHSPEGREATMTLAKESGSLTQRRLAEMISTLKSTLSGKEGGEESELVAWGEVRPPLPIPLPRPLSPREPAPVMGTKTIAEALHLGAMGKEYRR